MNEPKGKVCHYSDVPAEVFGDEAPGVTIRWVIDEERDGKRAGADRWPMVRCGAGRRGFCTPWQSTYLCQRWRQVLQVPLRYSCLKVEAKELKKIWLLQLIKFDFCGRALNRLY